MQDQVEKVISLIVKNGIRKYKFKNSKIRPFNQQPEGNKGSVFGFRSKEKMIDSRGIVFTSEEALSENEDCLSHWTPNVYSYGTYVDSNKSIVEGHFEKNLKQINCFVVDFDKEPGELLDAQMIIDAGIDLNLIPTLLLETPKGFQAYFVLESAWFISSKNNYASIKLAKHVSKNIRNAYAEVLTSVDLGCNHFGIARIPRNDNIIYFYPAVNKSMKEWINWSMNVETEKSEMKPVLQLLPRVNLNQVKEKWVDVLLNNPKIIGEKGKLGRNNVLFTLSLAYYSSKIDQERCQDDMDLFNSQLSFPLKQKEVERIINSAYSGRYKGANKEYVMNLLSNWSAGDKPEQSLFTQNRSNWYKFKKDRSERKQSHIHEWKKDILSYLECKCYAYRPEITLTKSELQSNIKFNGKEIPKRSLDKALQELISEGNLYVQVKAGRGGGLVVSTRKALIRTILVVNREVKEAYKNAIRTFFDEAAILTNLIIKDHTRGDKRNISKQSEIWDTG